jgi:hypothetical protein
MCRVKTALERSYTLTERPNALFVGHPTSIARTQLAPASKAAFGAAACSGLRRLRPCALPCPDSSLGSPAAAGAWRGLVAAGRRSRCTFASPAATCPASPVLPATAIERDRINEEDLIRQAACPGGQGQGWERCAPSTLCTGQHAGNTWQPTGASSIQCIQWYLQPKRRCARGMLQCRRAGLPASRGPDPARWADMVTKLLAVQAEVNFMEAPSIRPGFWWSPTLEDQHADSSSSNSSPPCLDEAVLLSNGNREYLGHCPTSLTTAKRKSGLQRCHGCPAPLPVLQPICLEHLTPAYNPPMTCTGPKPPHMPHTTPTCCACPPSTAGGDALAALFSGCGPAGQESARLAAALLPSHALEQPQLVRLEEGVSHFPNACTRSMSCDPGATPAPQLLVRCWDAPATPPWLHVGKQQLYLTLVYIQWQQWTLGSCHLADTGTIPAAAANMSFYVMHSLATPPQHHLPHLAHVPQMPAGLVQAFQSCHTAMLEAATSAGSSSSSREVASSGSAGSNSGASGLVLLHCAERGSLVVGSAGEGLLRQVPAGQQPGMQQCPAVAAAAPVPVPPCPTRPLLAKIQTDLAFV